MQITTTKSFSLTRALDAPVKITFLNRKGGLDTVLFTRFQDIEVKGKAQTYESGNTTRTYNVDSSKSVTYYSPWFTEAEFAWMEDLMESPYIQVNGRQVNAIDRNQKIDTINRLFSLELTVASEYGQNRISF
ncbi:hypothetical protein [uncultured Pontibacter sp.]|uniref:hypothetical protein n=1 Tax=uncultured Pontibacter sp. TaxID=453356 RepID=UPI0026236E15|nr:hypothetical protein [uncultured Pontibacter sp.]